MTTFKENTRINYQLMNEDDDGKYTPDYEELIRKAELYDPAQVEYIRSVQEKGTRFTWNMVYITKKNCGHYEIFQTMCNEYYPFEEVIEKALGYAEKSKCTRCICNF